MKKFALLGKSLTHSISPTLHNHWYKKYKISAEYSLLETPEEKIQSVLKRIRNKELDGLNVTIPYKNVVIPFLDEVINDAEKTASVNTIYLNEKNKLVGENTDVFGLECALIKKLESSKNQSALILGAGGVTPSIIYALQKANINKIFVSNRTLKKVEEIKKKFSFINIISWEKIDEYKCFIVMRCWNPRATETIKKVKEFNPGQIILLPLYPQFSNATSGSSINEWLDVCKKEDLNTETKIICCYPNEKDFVLSYSNLIKEKIIKEKLNETTLIFSAHGLPENKIKQGDPYQSQVESTVNALVKHLSISGLNYILSYQSRVGPLKWIGPSTDDVIKEESKKNKIIIVVPVAFVSEHSETLVELDIEYSKLAKENGSKQYIRVPTVTIEKNFINSLKSSILAASKGERFTSSLRCAEKFKKCPRLQKYN